MKREVYEIVLSVIQENLKNGRKRYCITLLQQQYPSISDDSLLSIYSQSFQRDLKKKFSKHHKFHTVKSYYKRFLSNSAKKKPNSILDLSNEVDFPPVMMARIILEQYLLATFAFNDGTVPKGYITKLLKNPSLIEEKYLAEEVKRCLDVDENCGPVNDAVKNNIGAEYEQRLKQTLLEKKIPFMDEDELRKLGYDKTPDIRLHIPIAVDGYVVNWIESKASFGDPESHSGYMTTQFWSYCNRFGPGLVIYWFGFVDDLDSNRVRGIMLCHGFPGDIVTLDMLL